MKKVDLMRIETYWIN